MRSPGLDENIPVDKPKEKKNKGSGKKSKKTKAMPSTSSTDGLPALEKSQTGSLNTVKSANPTKEDMPGPGDSLSLGQDSSVISTKSTTAVLHPTASSGDTSAGTGEDVSTAPENSDVESLTGRSDKDSEDGEISDSGVAEQNEEMNYRETVRAVRAFLGWSNIPDFEFSVADGDRSDNPWKGKHPRKTGKVSVELPADDWLCHKMEKLNTRLAEGYPSHSQESASLKTDQFERTPKSQSKWYKQYQLRQDTNVRPGRTIFSWSDSEARLNAQFSRVAKASSYPQSGPASRPVPQDILRRWEKCAREGTCVTNHAAGFNHCTSEIQDKMNTDISLLNDVIVKGKAPKEVVEAIKDLKDFSSFHSSISVALGTALQHLADSLFVQLANFITPQPLRAVGVLFSPTVSGWAGGWAAGNSLSGLYLRNRKV